MLKKVKNEVTNPIPMESLESECKKAYTILSGFATPVKHQPDKFIPPFVIQRARGLAVLSVVKGGFMFSGRVGAGVVISRTEDGGWSAPAAIGTAGVGWGFQIGAELADFVIILNTKDAVKAFSHGNVTLGGNLSVAAGPIGRNAEASAAVTLAAVFSYSRTRGLFAGVSLEGSVIAERKDANKKFYGEHCTTRGILSGAVPRPAAARDLYDLLAKVDHNESKSGSQIHDSHSHSQSHGHPSSTPGGFPGAPPPSGHYDPHGSYRDAPPGQGGYGGPPPGGYQSQQSLNNNGYHDPYNNNNHMDGGYRDAPPGGYGGPPPGYDSQQNFGGPPPGGPGYQSQQSYGGPQGGYGGPPPLQQQNSQGNFQPQGSFQGGPPGMPQQPPRSVSGGGSGFGPPGGQMQQQNSQGNFQPQGSFQGGPPQGGYGGAPPLQQQNSQGSFQQPQGSFQGGPQGGPLQQGGPQGGYGGPPPMQQQGSFQQRDMGPGQNQPQPSQGGGPIGRAKGMYNFDAADETELSFKFDDIIVVWKQHGDWWEGEINGRRGLVPANYVELIQ